MARCGYRSSSGGAYANSKSFQFEFDDDEKLDSVALRRRAANAGRWGLNNKPGSSTGRVTKLKRSSVRGIILANEVGASPAITSPRAVSQKDMVAASFYDSVASKTGESSTFHLKSKFTGIVNVIFNRDGKWGFEAIPMITNLKARPKPITEIEKKPKLVPGTWMQTARPRSPYVSEGILFAELQFGSGYAQRAHAIPKKYHLIDNSGYFGMSTGNRNETYILDDCIKRSVTLEYMDSRWVDVWVGGKDCHGDPDELRLKGKFQQWGIRIGNWWFVQEGQDKTKIVRKSASKHKKDLIMWKRIGCTTCKGDFIQNDFIPAYTESKPAFHLEKHNAKHMTAAMVTALGLECPFWTTAAAVAKGCVKELSFNKRSKGSFKSIRAIRLY